MPGDRLHFQARQHRSQVRGPKAMGPVSGHAADAVQWVTDLRHESLGVEDTLTKEMYYDTRHSQRLETLSEKSRISPAPHAECENVC